MIFFAEIYQDYIIVHVFFLVEDGQFDAGDEEVSQSDDSSMDQLSAAPADSCGVYSDDSDLDIWE